MDLKSNVLEGSPCTSGYNIVLLILNIIIYINIITICYVLLYIYIADGDQ